MHGAGKVWYLDAASGPLDQAMPIPAGARYVQVSAPNAVVDVFWQQGSGIAPGVGSRCQRVAANDTGRRLMVPCGAATFLRVSTQITTGTLTVAFSEC
jgi:hypothetical protein